MIYNFNVNDMMPVAMIALSGEDLSQLQNLAEETVGPALERLDGVASADIMGGIDSQVTVEVNTTALTGYGLTCRMSPTTWLPPMYFIPAVMCRTEPIP